MPVEGLDHVAITVADVEATVEWYERVLGAQPLLLDLWREGKVPVVLLQIGASRLSVLAAAAPAAPHANSPTVGANDICFRYGGPVSEVLRLLEKNGIDIVDGPVPRPASNGERGQSVYFRDPDENLIELLTLTA
jgi:catechol 2,3-dioxygenase-like lactoylglutathione lyase family enzyme